MGPRVSRTRQFFHEYRSLLILGCAALLAELAYAILNLSAMPMYVSKELHEGSHYGLIFGTFLATEALSRPALGALGDRIGRKPLMVAAPAITAVTSYLTILVGGPMVVPILIGLRALDGLGSSALWMNAFASIGDIVGEKNRSAAMSVLNVTYMGGMALGFLLGGAANDHFHTLHASFYLASILFVMAFLVMLIFFPKGKLQDLDIHIGVAQVVAVEHYMMRILRGAWNAVLSMVGCFKEVPDMVVMAIVTFLGMGMLTPIVKLYGFDHYQLTETQFGLAVAPIAAAMGLAALPLGHLGDRFGKTTAVCWGLLASSVAMWAIAIFSRSLHIAAAAGVLIGLGFTVAFPAWNALVISSTDRQRRGEVLGAVGLAQGIAAMAGTLMSPYIYYSDGLSFPKLGIVNYNVPFWISAIMISIGTVICFTWVCNRRVVPGSGEFITLGQRRIVVATAIVGLVALGSWIGWRYTMPVTPDRVAWSWVQQLARSKPKKAVKYSIVRTEGWDGRSEARTWAKTFHQWVYGSKASYQVQLPDYLSENQASADVRFNFPGGEPSKTETVLLCKTKPRGQWKVCGIRAGD